MKNYRTLPPVREHPSDWEQISLLIIKLFKREIYLPLLRESKKIHNSRSDLLEAIRKGTITYNQGRFEGSFSSVISRELRNIGAKWSKQQGCFLLPQSQMEPDIIHAISVAESTFIARMNRISDKLSKLNPKEIASKLRFEKFFDKTIWRVVDHVNTSLSVKPNFSKMDAARISKEYTENMQLYIQDFLEKEIVELRERVIKNSVKGKRFEAIQSEIKRSYGVSQSKAKFLARQESMLLMTKISQINYQNAGVHEYKWTCVKMPHQAKNAPYVPGEVRHDHAVLDGKIFRWDNPPVVDQKTGRRANVGTDFGCRCIGVPVVRF